jgi:hypothetical protein
MEPFPDRRKSLYLRHRPDASVYNRRGSASWVSWGVRRGEPGLSVGSQSALAVWRGGLIELAAGDIKWQASHVQWISAGSLDDRHVRPVLGVALQAPARSSQMPPISHRALLK